MPFPKNFVSVVKQIFKRLFRVYAHIYYNHFQKIVSLGEEAHLNTCFKRLFFFCHFILEKLFILGLAKISDFYLFINEFQLVEKRETAPLQELIDNLQLS